MHFIQWSWSGTPCSSVYQCGALQENTHYTVWNHQLFRLYPAGNLMFMQDNAQVHTVRIKTSFLKADGVEVLSLVWAVHRPQPHQIFVEIFKSKDSRQEILQCQWHLWRMERHLEKIPFSYVRKLIDSIPSRCQMLCSHYGYPTKYWHSRSFLTNIGPFCHFFIFHVIE